MIKVGITEMHGIAKEYSQFPPDGVHYSEIHTSDRLTKYIFKSAAKGVFAYAHDPSQDLLEAPLFPVLTNQPWIYTPAHFSSAGSYDLFGVPTPRFFRMLFASQLLKRKNFKKLIFKSEYGRRSLIEYGGIDSETIANKTMVVNPVVRRISDEHIVFQNDHINILFVGEFLRKGGADVVDAFLRLLKEYDGIYLTLCCQKNFQTRNLQYKNQYLKKIDECPFIEMKFVTREELFSSILPKADIYLCPTYQEAWGFSIQEAMAFGIPVVATNINAIPEIIDDGESGILIDVRDHPYIRGSSGYIVDNIPADFKAYMTENVYNSIKLLIDDFEYRKRIGLNGLNVARTKFSIENRNRIMAEVYQDAVR